MAPFFQPAGPATTPVRIRPRGQTGPGAAPTLVPRTAGATAVLVHRAGGAAMTKAREIMTPGAE
ncbi:hypothetical protein ACFP5Z_17630, partial [Kocuria oceani]